MKNYWTWTCHNCGFDYNRNTDKRCRDCNAQIRCEQAGGHYYPASTGVCDNGCGRTVDGGFDATQRRVDY